MYPKATSLLFFFSATPRLYFCNSHFHLRSFIFIFITIIIIPTITIIFSTISIVTTIIIINIIIIPTITIIFFTILLTLLLNF
eukprot:jgi/Botrbrau1/3241/Bobra.174_1s0013.1